MVETSLEKTNITKARGYLGIYMYVPGLDICNSRAGTQVPVSLNFERNQRFYVRLYFNVNNHD